MAFNPPDSNVFYPVPPGQLPPGFVAPPPGTAVRGIPIVVPHGLEMLISPEGFPVFVPERSSAPPPPYLSSPPAIPNSSPSVPSRHNTVSSQHHTLNQYPTPPTRHTTMPAAQTNQYPTPPPPVPALPVAQTPVSLPHQMPLPTYVAPTHAPPPSFAPPSHAPPAFASPSHAPPAFAPPGYAPPAFAPPAHAPPAHAPPARAPPPAGLTFASIVSSFRTSSENVSAWIFYSMGLVHNPGQKEIVITLRQRPGSYTLESIQPIMYNLYHQMNSFIQSSGGKPLVAGDIFPCRLNTPDLGPLDRAILLIHSPAECRGTMENKDVLDLAGPVMVGLVKTYLGESTGFPRIAYGIRLGVADEKYRCDLGFDHSSIDDGGILGRVGIDPDEFEEITTGTTGVD
ncbi:hypothetical protein BGZ79_009498 [Entomortierella chlamydospora]|nr:hypothetical protein BGZ79_009498 [Entomortierella chlamydospora]